MRNNGQELCSELTDIEVQAKDWERKKIQEDARKFEQIIRESRIRIGLER